MFENYLIFMVIYVGIFSFEIKYNNNKKKL